MPRQPQRLREKLAVPQSVVLSADLHPLVAAWMEWDRQAEETACQEKRDPPAKDEDTVMGRRKLRIYDVLLKAAEAKGYVLGRPKGYLTPVWLTIRGRRIEWSLREQSSPRRVPLSKAELKQPHNIANGIETKEIRVPTGTLKLIASTDFGQKTQITERLDNPLEGRAEEILSRFETIADAANVREVKLATWHRRFGEEKRAEERVRRLDAIEDARWEYLREVAKDWKEADTLRAFIRAVERKLGGMKRPARVTAWLQWAKDRVDLLDPLAGEHASALDDIIRWRYYPKRSEYELSIWELS